MNNHACTSLDAGQVIRWTSLHRWTAVCLLAYIYLAVTVAVQRQQDTGSGLDAGLIPITVTELLRLLRDTVIPPTPARPPPPAALVHRAAPPPAPRPPSPPTLEHLCRDNTMVTTNYSRHISAEGDFPPFPSTTDGLGTVNRRCRFPRRVGDTIRPAMRGRGRGPRSIDCTASPSRPTLRPQERLRRCHRWVIRRMRHKLAW